MSKPNIIFIVIDTLRKDYSKELEKNLRRQGFICYDNAIAPAPWTTPTHASIFTGLYPAFHNAHETKTEKLSVVTLRKKELLLTDMLHYYGYKTYLLSANPLIDPTFGFTGFDYVYNYSFAPSLGIVSITEKKLLNQYIEKYKAFSRWERRIRAFSDMCLHGDVKLAFKIFIEKSLKYPHLLFSKLIHKWPTEKGSTKLINQIRRISFTQPIFIFMNFMEVHDPYFLKNRDYEITINNYLTGQIDHEYVLKWKKGYKKQVIHITGKIEQLFKELKSRNLFENSLVILTSDHGQLLGEYGRLNHGTFLYDELIRVPLCIRYPDGIEPLPPKKSEFVSLTSLKRFVLGLAKGELLPDLYSQIVFSEVYGTHLDYSYGLLSPREKQNLEELEKYRIAIYYKNFKGVFNVTDWKFEEIKSYDPSVEITEDVIKHLKKEVMKFLKTATIAKVPKIKL